MEMKTSAQNKEDLVLIQYFQKRGGVFVDVGAHDGVQFSNTHLLETKYGWTGVCIEPNPDSFKNLKKNRPNSQCFEVAIVNCKSNRIQLLVPNGVAVLGSTSPKRAGIGRILGIQPGNVKYQNYTVAAERLCVTLERGEIPPNFDLLSIDTEWTELEALASARLGIHHPEVIVVEANDSDFAKEIENYLIAAGYHLCGFVGGINYFYVDNESNVTRMSEAIAHVASGSCPNM